MHEASTSLAMSIAAKEAREIPLTAIRVKSSIIVIVNETMPRKSTLRFVEIHVRQRKLGIISYII